MARRTRDGPGTARVRLLRVGAKTFSRPRSPSWRNSHDQYTDGQRQDCWTPFRLEGVVIPVADFDAAKNFYQGLGWRFDASWTWKAGTTSPSSLRPNRTPRSSSAPRSPPHSLAVSMVCTSSSMTSTRLVRNSSHPCRGERGVPRHRWDRHRRLSRRRRRTSPWPGSRRSFVRHVYVVQRLGGKRWVPQEITVRAPGRV
jgi:hypothetical protein